MPKNSKKQAPFGCLFWIAFILLIFVLFFINKDSITRAVRSLQESGFFTEDSGDGIVPGKPQPQTIEDGGIRIDVQPGTEAGNGGEAAETEPAGETEPDAGETDAKMPVPPAEDITALQGPEPPDPDSGAEETPPAAAAGGKPETGSGTAQNTVPMRKQRLYFVSIDSDGAVLRQEVVKDIPKSDSPLADALHALFAGPSASEAEQGLISLIPPGTRLLSAVVKNGVATLNLSEDFRFNRYGIEGYIGQLSQVVFTATTFPTVTAVQFLLDGQRRDYLGAEGVWIGTPLGRKDFTP